MYFEGVVTFGKGEKCMLYHYSTSGLNLLYLHHCMPLLRTRGIQCVLLVNTDVHCSFI